MNNDKNSKVAHTWTIYVHPRNGAMSIRACSACGVAQSAIATKGVCRQSAKRGLNTFINRGWLEKKANYVA